METYDRIILKLIKTLTIILLLSVHGLYANNIQLEDLLTSRSGTDNLVVPSSNIRANLIASSTSSLSELSFNHDRILSEINEVRQITANVNTQLRSVLEDYIKRNPLSFCQRLVLRANQSVLCKLLSMWLEEGLSQLSCLSRKASVKLEGVQKKVNKQTTEALDKISVCCEGSNEVNKLVESTRFEIQECINEKIGEMDEIYEQVNSKLNEIKEALREFPFKFVACMATNSSNSEGLITCIRQIGRDITMTTPKAAELVTEGEKFRVVLLKIIEGIFDCAKTRFQSMKFELSATTGLLMGACLYNIRLPFID